MTGERELVGSPGVTRDRRAEARHAPYYPVFLDLQGRKAVVIGDNHEVERKVTGLLNAGAVVTVVAERPGRKVEALAGAGRVSLRRRDYQEGDLTGAFLAVAATASDRGLSQRIAEEAGRTGTLLNVTDVTDLCVWIAPAIVSRGDLTLAVSSNGLSPAMTRHVRDKLDALLPDEYGTLLDILAGIRDEVRRSDVRPPSQAWQDALDEETMRLLSAHDRDGVRRRIRARLAKSSRLAAAAASPVEETR